MQALSIEELAKSWAVSVADLEREIGTGRLQTFSVNGQLRVPVQEAERFMMGQSAASEPNPTTSRSVPDQETILQNGWKFSLLPGSESWWLWPDGVREVYRETYEGSASDGKQQARVRVGFTDRAAVGQLRRRVVVFIDQRPTVEFVGADDFERTRLMASVLKDRNNKQVVSPDVVPLEYKRFDVRPFRQLISGRYASHSLAVVAHSEDHATMVGHGLIRAAYKQVLG